MLFGPASCTLPADLERVFLTATEMVELLDCIIHNIDPTDEPPPPPSQPLSREQKLRAVAQYVAKLETLALLDGPALLALSDEITAANRHPVFLDEFQEVQPNAHRAALTSTDVLLELIHTELSWVVHGNFDSLDDVPASELEELVVLHHKHLAGEMRLLSWPDPDALRARLVVEASVTAHARRKEGGPKLAPAGNPSGEYQPCRVRKPRRRDPKRDERDQWLYEQQRDGSKSWKAIQAELARVAAANGWEDLGSEQAVQQAVARYLERVRQGLTPLPDDRGRQGGGPAAQQDSTR